MIKNLIISVISLLGVAVIVEASALSSPIADAAMRRDATALRELLASGAKVDTPHGDGMTGLHWAARNGDAEIADTLITAGSDPEAVTRVGNHTPLHVASKFGQVSVVRILVEAGADVRAETATGTTPLHFASMSGSEESIALLLDHGADVNSKEFQWGQTPLMFASASGRTDAIRVLLEWEAEAQITAKIVDIAAREKTDKTEARRRSKRIAALRSKPGASAIPLDANGYEIEQGPVTAKLPSICQLCPVPSRDADLEAKEIDTEEDEVDLQEEPEPLGYAKLVGTHGGLTALLLAAREGHLEAVLALLDGGADINQGGQADGTTPLLIAIINGHFDLAKVLLERGASPTTVNDAGGTTLYAAINTQWIPKSRHPQITDYRQQETSYLQLIESLLSAGADPNARLKKSLWFTTYNTDQLGVDRSGATPFWRAAYATDIEAMELLVAHGADPDLATPTPAPRRPRGYAGPPRGRPSSVGNFFRVGGGSDSETPEEPELPDPSGLPPAKEGEPGVFPIHAASGVGYGTGFAGNAHRHAPDAWLQVVRYLVEELDADLDARDYNGYTALHHAASRGDNEMILYLVEMGADITVVSRRGQTTADMANGPVSRVSPFPATVALLERQGSKNSHSCVSC